MEITKQRNNLLYSSQYRTPRNFRGLKFLWIPQNCFSSIVESASESYLNLWKFNFAVIKDHQKHENISP